MVVCERLFLVTDSMQISIADCILHAHQMSVHISKNLSAVKIRFLGNEIPFILGLELLSLDLDITTHSLLFCSVWD